MGSSSSVKHRNMTAEEKALIAQQLYYMKEIQPTIDSALTNANTALNNSVTPDYNSLYSTALSNLSDIYAQQKDLANNGLSGNSGYAKGFTDYYNTLYQNTMGNSLASMAKNGVVDSSRFNTAAKDSQNTLSTQMSKDYNTGLTAQSTLLNNLATAAQQPLTTANTAATNSANTASQYATIANALQSQNTNATTAVTNANNNASYVVQKSGLF